MTPSKMGGASLQLMRLAAHPGPATATVSGIAASIDGEDYDYRLYSERDEDNLTLKNSEHNLRASLHNMKGSIISASLVGGVQST